jgi:hypothetical protein
MHSQNCHNVVHDTHSDCFNVRSTSLLVIICACAIRRQTTTNTHTVLTSTIMSTVTARSSANGHQTNGAPTHTNGVDKVVPSKDSRMSKDELKLMVAVLGIYGCYLTSGILQEHIYSYRTASGERFGQTLFLLWVQCVVNVLFAGIAMVVGKLNLQDVLDFGSACYLVTTANSRLVLLIVVMLSLVF